MTIAVFLKDLSALSELRHVYEISKGVKLINNSKLARTLNENFEFYGKTEQGG